ncbi:indolepyruvate oxidoreductase subunit beta [Candidatus Fermentibacteria bacterium]|nr:MAG: indolepyruvate oxidoreductase subunit beta [Candidatus Fermentibacteria bacterium]
MRRTKNIIICGTGGQGILMASEVLCSAAWRSGFDVKKSEVHGMAQRGGSVSSHVRFGEKVNSVLVEKGAADVILALEKMESLRWVSYLAPHGKLITCDVKIEPMTVNTGSAVYPDVEKIMDEMNIPNLMLPVREIAKELGNNRVVNIILLGAASKHLPEISEENWFQAVEERVPPKALEVNLEAFRRGRAL